MARPNWEYIRVDVLLPEHPKLDGMTAAAKWTVIEMWCYCGRQRTDGIITASRWRTFGTPAQRRDILAHGLADPILDGDGGYVMHDYTGHQRSREEIDELAARRADIARNAANARWGKDKPPLGTCRSSALSTCIKHAPSMRHAHA